MVVLDLFHCPPFKKKPPLVVEIQPLILRLNAKSLKVDFQSRIISKCVNKTKEMY